MKVIKKILSVFLSAVIIVSTMCIGTVSAGAEVKSKLTVAAYDNEDGNGITILVSGFAPEDIDSVIEIMKDGSLFSLAVFMDEAVGKECRFGFFMDSNVKLYMFNFDGKEITNATLPTHTNGFSLNNEKNCYELKFILEKDHKICDEITNAIKDGKEIRIDAEIVTPYGAILSMDSEFGGQTRFEVVPKWGLSDDTDSNAKDISSLSISKISNKTYTGKTVKPVVTIKDGEKKLVKGTDYTLSYKNNKKIGTATVTIKGKGDYTGEKTIEFKIVPKKTTLKVSKKSDTKATFSWTEVKGAEKYQIYVSKDGGKTYKLLKSVSGSKTSYTSTKLDFKKYDYKFKIRSYGTSDGKKYYSSYSKVKTVK